MPTMELCAIKSSAEPTTNAAGCSVKKAVSPRKGMAVRTTRIGKQPEKYVPSINGKSQHGSKDALCRAQRSVNLMSKELHRYADIVGMIMAQVSMKAALKKRGEAAKQAITVEMKPIHWCNSYKPMHWHEFTTAQKECILGSHIFVEEKRDGKIKARKVVNGL
jgi:hypothetical protein